MLAIKQTLYRTSGPDSPIVRSLIRAAESGKQVVALVELTARFDEEANITWAAELEKAGVHVVYGVVGLKTHAKATLVVRRTDDGIRRYCHMGTGNYNSKTARLYEDIGLLSADTELGEDLTDLFNYLTGYSRQRQYRRLLVAPVTLRSGIVELIRTQTHSDRPDHHQVQPPDRSRGHRGALRGVVRRGADRPHRAQLVRRASGHRRACPRTSGCARWSVATSSTRASTTSATTAGTSGRRT